MRRAIDAILLAAIRLLLRVLTLGGALTRCTWSTARWIGICTARSRGRQKPPPPSRDGGGSADGPGTPRHAYPSA